MAAEHRSDSFGISAISVIILMQLGFVMLEVGYLGYASNKSPTLLKVRSDFTKIHFLTFDSCIRHNFH
jgi:hypothetical protein